jgi:Domain of unknown function DUF29
MDVHHRDAMADNADLYAEDFAAWCLKTAELVRTGEWDAIDPEALAEELESLGKSQKRELESRLEVLVMHLLKWKYQPDLREESHSWYDTICEQRSELERLLRDNPSLQRQVPVVLPELYPKAHRRARGEMRLPRREPPSMGAPPLETIRQEILRQALLPKTCPWIPKQVLDDDFLPDAFMR